jgi:hypothetical protein
MKETYFLIKCDYFHFMHLISASWTNGKPKQLEVVLNELYGRFHFNAIRRIVE